MLNRDTLKIQGNELIVYIRRCICVDKSITENRVRIREEKKIRENPREAKKKLASGEKVFGFCE